MRVGGLHRSLYLYRDERGTEKIERERERPRRYCNSDSEIGREFAGIELLPSLLAFTDTSLGGATGSVSSNVMDRMFPESPRPFR